MVTWSTAKTLLFTLGPILIPKLWGLFRKTRSSIRPPVGTKPISLPRKASYALNILFLSSVCALVFSLPYFAPENIYTLTSSRLQTPPDVLFTRLAKLRPDGVLSGEDELLRSHMLSMRSRLLYLSYGPDPITHCSFCSSKSSTTYLYFAAPALAVPHILHALMLGIATSLPLSGEAASKWRTIGSLAVGALPALELFALASYDHTANTAAITAEDLNFFHWRMRTYRYIAIALVDLLLAGLIYAMATKRAFVPRHRSIAEQTEILTRRVEESNRKLHALGIMKNAVLRDDKLREATGDFWSDDSKVRTEIFEDREVLDRMRGVLGRIDVNSITEEATKYADGMLSGVVFADFHVAASQEDDAH